ncbi:hypothetical protein C8R45DRAFT_84192 [Mycena sanguinolenta]|nr:hypothetical protein C8R45DRAFT_84192 [Mycena sanguinolenta]
MSLFRSSVLGVFLPLFRCCSHYIPFPRRFSLPHIFAVELCTHLGLLFHCRLSGQCNYHRFVRAAFFAGEQNFASSAFLLSFTCFRSLSLNVHCHPFCPFCTLYQKKFWACFRFRFSFSLHTYLFAFNVDSAFKISPRWFGHHIFFFGLPRTAVSCTRQWRRRRCLGCCHGACAAVEVRWRKGEVQGYGHGGGIWVDNEDLELDEGGPHTHLINPSSRSYTLEEDLV